jgi:hypothetical protein
MKFEYPALALTGLLLLAACGRGAPEADETDAAATLSMPVCDYVTVDELHSFTGRTYQPGQVTASQPTMHRCTWQSEEEAAGSIMFTVYPVNADSAMEQYLAFPGMEQIDGLGDQVWWSPSVQTYLVRLGDRLIAVGFGTHDSGHRNQAARIAGRALERL